jgi:hypothetical protein
MRLELGSILRGPWTLRGMSRFVIFSNLERHLPTAHSLVVQGLLQPNVLSSSTVHDFMSDSLDLEEGGFSALAIHTQAALLFERATYVAAQWRAGMSHPIFVVHT